MSKFQAEFPDRMFDVGIAEQHAMTFATGLAMGGMRPVVALYSTFLQRAFDQTVHDVCQNDQPVLIAVDRAGLVGEDGTSHQGMFTLPAQRQLPNLVIASPKDEQELRSLLRTALGQDHPFALHYPRDAGLRPRAGDAAVIPIGQGEVLREGHDILFVGFGPIVMRGARGRRRARGRGLVGRGHQRPLRASRSTASSSSTQARGKRLVVTFEESVVTGGFGSGVLELLEEARLADPVYRETSRADRRHPRRPVRRPRLGDRPAARPSPRCGRVWPRRSARRSRRSVPRPAAPRSPRADDRIRSRAAGCATIGG